MNMLVSCCFEDEEDEDKEDVSSASGSFVEVRASA